MSLVGDYDSNSDSEHENEQKTGAEKQDVEMQEETKIYTGKKRPLDPYFYEEEADGTENQEEKRSKVTPMLPGFFDDGLGASKLDQMKNNIAQTKAKENKSTNTKQTPKLSNRSKLMIPPQVRTKRANVVTEE